MRVVLNSYKSVLLQVSAIQSSKFQKSSFSKETTTTVNNSRRLKKYDCIVVGLGAHGSSTLYHLAKNGLNVLGIEQFKVAHSFGSSHGLSRIIRLAYFEDPAYVAMLRRAYTLWSELEAESGRILFTRTGSLDIGPRNSRIFAGSKKTCEQEKLDHEVLTQSQLATRFPGWNKIPKSADLCAIFQPMGGFLHPERCIEAHSSLAQERHGAQVHEQETVTSVEFKNGGDEAIVRTNTGGEYLTSKVVLSPGAWLTGLIKRSPALANINVLQKVARLLDPQRNVVIWYKSQFPQLYATEVFPVFVLDYQKKLYYGFPISGLSTSDHEQLGFKIGLYHHRQQSLTQEALDSNAEWRTKFEPEDEKVIGRAVKDLLPDAYGPVLKQTACIFTNTPDEHFIIDALPDPKYKSLALLSACSGHGFKFASVVGEAMATMILRNDDDYSRHAKIDWLKAKRFS